MHGHGTGGRRPADLDALAVQKLHEVFRVIARQRLQRGGDPSVGQVPLRPPERFQRARRMDGRVPEKADQSGTVALRDPLHLVHLHPLQLH